MKLLDALKVKIFLVFTFFIGFVLLADAGVSPFAENSQLSSAEISAQEIYAQHCARCHGADGRGDTESGRTYDVPNITDAKWQKRHSDQKITKAIVKGGGGMPAFGKKLSKKEISALTAYVRSLKK